MMVGLFDNHCISYIPSFCSAAGDNLETAAAEADNRGRGRPEVHVPAEGPRGPAAGRARHAVLQGPIQQENCSYSFNLKILRLPNFLA